MLAFVSLLCAPLVAHAGHITLAWDVSAGTVSGYLIYYGTSPGSLTTTIDVGNRTSHVVDGLASGVTYYFEVRAYTELGELSGPSNQVRYAAFSEPELVSTVAPVRALHIAEMRLRIDALRLASGLAPVLWIDPVLTAGVTTVKAVHITQMRTALTQVYSARNRPAPTYTDPNLTVTATLITGAHISDLRTAIMTAE